jgi:hypothetical protein
MAEGSGLETYANHTNATTTSTPAGDESEAVAASGDAALRRTLLVVAIAAASAGLAFAIVRATLTRRPSDPTTERIQQLIDEANRLLKQLDDKKPD